VDTTVPIMRAIIIFEFKVPSSEFKVQ